MVTGLFEVPEGRALSKNASRAWESAIDKFRRPGVCVCDSVDANRDYHISII